MEKGKNYLVSACLLGVPCRYDGKSKPCERVLSLMKDNTLIPVCPEQMGGLPTPRLPSECQGEKVTMKSGRDVTDEYTRGAQCALHLYELYHCDAAILKAKSPSCGCGKIYDGTFTGTLTDGDGMTARLLKAKGYRVMTELDVPD